VRNFLFAWGRQGKQCLFEFARLIFLFGFVGLRNFLFGFPSFLFLFQRWA
jgi:hypothetical protein